MSLVLFESGDPLGDYLRRILFLPRQESTVAADIDHLHYFVILTTMAGAVLITLVGGYFLFRYREREDGGPQADHDVNARPPLWMKTSAVALLFALFVIWWAIGLWQYVTLRVAPEGALDVYVTAKQWMWKFAYPGGARSISVLYVPARRPMRLIMTSRDVIHSFYVPEFRVKQDVVPGRYTTLWFEAKAPGTYPILCAEYCGDGHSTMRGWVVALEPADFDGWLGGKDLGEPLAGQDYRPPAVVGDTAPPEMVDMAREGERVAGSHGCFRCHTPDGTPHIGPTWAGLYGARIPLASGGEVLADEAYLTESIMDPLAKIHAGFQPVMPSYQGRIQTGQIAAILEYIKSIRDVTPEPGVAMPLADAGVEFPAPAPPSRGGPRP
jgi:cytochrome c oxidase subunit II